MNDKPEPVMWRDPVTNKMKVGGLNRPGPSPEIVKMQGQQILSEAAKMLDHPLYAFQGVTNERYPDAPAWAIELNMMFESLRLEVLATQAALIKSRTLRPHEITEEKLVMQQVAEEQLREAMSQLGRQFVQKPNPLPGQPDPRTNGL